MPAVRRYDSVLLSMRDRALNKGRAKSFSHFWDVVADAAARAEKVSHSVDVQQYVLERAISKHYWPNEPFVGQDPETSYDSHLPLMYNNALEHGYTPREFWDLWNRSGSMHNGFLAIVGHDMPESVQYVREKWVWNRIFQDKDKTRPSIQFPGVDPDKSSRTERRRRGDFHGPGASGRADRYRPGGRPQPQLIDRGRSKESSREKKNAKYLDQEIDRLLSGEGYFQREESQLAHVSDYQPAQPAQPAPRKHQADIGVKHERGLPIIAQVHTELSRNISSINTANRRYKTEPQGPPRGTPSPGTQRAIVNSRHNQNRDGLMFSPKLPAGNAEVSKILGSFGNSPTSTIPAQRMEHRPMVGRPGLSERLAEKLAKEKQVMEQRKGIKRPLEEDLFAAKDDNYDTSEEAKMKRIKSDRVAMFAFEEDDGCYD